MIWKRPIVKLERRYTVMRLFTKHTTGVVLLCALGGIAIDNLLGSLRSLCSSVSLCALHLVLPGAHAVFQWSLPSTEVPGPTHTFRVLQLLIGLCHYVEPVMKRASTK